MYDDISFLADDKYCTNCLKITKTSDQGFCEVCGHNKFVVKKETLRQALKEAYEKKG